jgi:hypothetical protein
MATPDRIATSTRTSAKRAERGPAGGRTRAAGDEKRARLIDEPVFPLKGRESPRCPTMLL